MKYCMRPSALYHGIIRKRHTDYLVRELESLKGRDVLFWGQGSAYRTLKDRVGAYVRPLACVLDDGYRNPETDRAGILGSAEALRRHGADIPIVVFGKPSILSRMHHSVRQRGFTGKIISCSDVAAL